MIEIFPSAKVTVATAGVAEKKPVPTNPSVGTSLAVELLVDGVNPSTAVALERPVKPKAKASTLVMRARENERETRGSLVDANIKMNVSSQLEVVPVELLVIMWPKRTMTGHICLESRIAHVCLSRSLPTPHYPVTFLNRPVIDGSGRLRYRCQC